ncbi:hypothetical protein DIZ81_06205 [Legionella taurinensis]|uniref:Uncharacterized protein n=1 Tax=Legionella taurinensis TaxID=70611 RepID=A0A3A5L5I9_9GAMM|nr:hypothetical protein [Legionella taurinensis]MDX1837511.1 hypothetical protein [Legionella taurinensis]PUT40851.1 hypothetical protein DB744_06205 [Legionella taurinensis]PUT44272.1 hypothetical protein DB746_04605 [Legionella taurinensis]PUT47574.1 hypothetical protein DB743_02775 [Legionella taurinensis]PUT48713.1 hypothetical protein DB745_04605 [Legionella taurinensis]
MHGSRKKLIEQIAHQEAVLYRCYDKVLAHKQYLSSVIERQESLLVLLVIPLVWGWRQGRVHQGFRQLLRLTMSTLLVRSAALFRRKLLQTARRSLVYTPTDVGKP